MTEVTLGRTGLTVNKDGFGVLPLQRTGMEEAARILNRALDGGMNYYDTARAYTDSEEKIGRAISSRRGEFILATKTMAGNTEAFRKDLETSLRNLKTPYIDIYQFHNPQDFPRPGDGTGLYEAMLTAREQGKIRFIGITNHRLPVARAAAESGLYDTLQFPFSYLSDERDAALVRDCGKLDVGFICMKALSGGLITDVSAARSWLMEYPNALPIWGIQREGELEALFEAQQQPAVLSAAQRQRIEKDRAELSGNFCRACGYCLPCPAEIEITMCARMFLLLRRMPAGPLLSEQWQREMAKIPNCLHCNHCKDNCPYGLDTPALLERNYEDYRKALEEAGAAKSA
ncbi:MAG: aldo/keto reductase [Spirochaetaceae bacterium]|jgi:aryl-alcohol dehydrogenase-like predicted oxidoreductase|nr:aldo/keto reductase [Spirochaetaceae bacterium]